MVPDDRLCGPGAFFIDSEYRARSTACSVTLEHALAAGGSWQYWSSSFGEKTHVSASLPPPRLALFACFLYLLGLAWLHLAEDWHMVLLSIPPLL